METQIRRLGRFGYGPQPPHEWQIHDPVMIELTHPAIIKLSIFGLIHMFNVLPHSMVNASSVRQFQHRLQTAAKEAASDDAQNWQLIYRAS